MSNHEWPIPHLYCLPGTSRFIEMMRGALKAAPPCAGGKKGEKGTLSTDTSQMRLAEDLAAEGPGTQSYRGHL
jgi:hypothetical protein